MIIIELPKDRAKVGRLTVVDWKAEIIAGPFPALGKADNKAAITNGNPKRNPIKPFGDTPTGLYELSITDPLTPQESYGPNSTLRMTPVSGQALKAKLNGRRGLLIHGGLPGAGRRLRSTHGCVRLFNEDMKLLLDAVTGNPELLRCSISEGSKPGTSGILLESLHYEHDSADLNPNIYPEIDAPADVMAASGPAIAAPIIHAEFCIDTDLKNVASPLSAQMIDDFFAAQPKGKRSLYGIGSAVISASIANIVNASYIVAHAILETGWGTSTIYREKNNLFGWTAYDSNPGGAATKFQSREDCISKVVPIINSNYLTPGGKYFSKRPCVGNKKYGMNVNYASDPDWGAKIASIARRLERSI
ncbi:MAG: glucosaminidase domain-containing protein [Cyanobacteria bacterium HKST-UBA02]|nr:glucosaminidase domain-containing protein [Cyanobacteria bacterium HKST-UBA02]